MSLRNKVRISQCMIVRDEESNIEQALSWGKDIMWEQIVVDTGSRDRTAELARELGAKVCRYEWTDDFAAAKNYALSQAKGDWIAFLDADEYVREEETGRIPGLLRRVEDGPCLALVTELLNLDDDGRVFSRGSHMRFFRNRPDLRYQGRIHENLCRDGELLKQEELLNTGDAFYIYHTGYRESVMEDGRKGRRDRQIIERELKERPGSWELMGYLADCYRVEKDYDQAILWYERAVSVFSKCGGIDDGDPQVERIFSFLMFLLAAEGREEGLKRVYDMAVGRQPLEPDYDYIIGKYYACKGMWEKGTAHLERAMELLKQCGETLRGVFLTGGLTEAVELLAVCCYRRGQRDKCVGYCSDILSRDRYSMSALALLMKNFMEDEEEYSRMKAGGRERPGGQAASAAQVAMFLGRFYDFNALKDRIFVLRAAAESEYGDMVRVMRGTFSAEELEALDRALGRE